MRFGATLERVRWPRQVAACRDGFSLAARVGRGQRATPTSTTPGRTTGSLDANLPCCRLPLANSTTLTSTSTRFELVDRSTDSAETPRQQLPRCSQKLGNVRHGT